MHEERISGNIIYLKSKYSPYDKGQYLIEIDRLYRIRIPSSKVRPEDLRKMADHLDKIRTGE